MTERTQEEVYMQDLMPYIERGNKCVLWGREVPDMTRDELVAFIGFLDELATQRLQTDA